MDRYQHDTEGLRCWREEHTFWVARGPEQLDAALEVFLDWADTIEGAG